MHASFEQSSFRPTKNPPDRMTGQEGLPPRTSCNLRSMQSQELTVGPAVVPDILVLNDERLPIGAGTGRRLIGPCSRAAP